MALHPVVEPWESLRKIHVDLSAFAMSDRAWLDRDLADEYVPPPLIKDPLQGLPKEDEGSRAWIVDSNLSKFSTVLFALENVSGHHVHRTDSTHSIAKTIQFQTKESKRALVAYERRIDELEEQAQPYGYAMRIESKAAFLMFLNRMPQIRQAGLVLKENGNLRAIWKGEDGAHLGLQFISPESIQYVIFKRRRLASSMSRVAGRDTIEGIIRQLDTFDLRGIMSR